MTPLQHRGWDHALLVGVSDYRLSPLQCPVWDVADMSASLREKAGFPATNITECLNPTREDFELVLNDFCQNKLVPGNSVLLYFSGHGRLQMPTYKYHLVFREAGQEPYSMSLSDVLQQIAAVVGEQGCVVAFTDTCRTVHSVLSDLSEAELPDVQRLAVEHMKINHLQGTLDRLTQQRLELFSRLQSSGLDFQMSESEQREFGALGTPMLMYHACGLGQVAKEGTRNGRYTEILLKHLFEWQQNLVVAASIASADYYKAYSPCRAHAEAPFADLRPFLRPLKFTQHSCWATRTAAIKGGTAKRADNPSHEWCNRWRSLDTEDEASRELTASSAAAAEVLVAHLDACRSNQPKCPVVWLGGQNLMVELHQHVDFASVIFALGFFAASKEWEAICQTHTVCFIGSSDVCWRLIDQQHRDGASFWALIWELTAAFCRNVRTLDLQGVFLDETDVADFAQRAMPHLTSLEVLDLSSAHITDQGVQAIVSSSKYLAKLKVLNLAGNLISNKGVAVLAREAVPSWPQLLRVEVSGSKCYTQTLYRAHKQAAEMMPDAQLQFVRQRLRSSSATPSCNQEVCRNSHQAANTVLGKNPQSEYIKQTSEHSSASTSSCSSNMSCNGFVLLLVACFVLGSLVSWLQ